MRWASCPCRRGALSCHCWEEAEEAEENDVQRGRPGDAARPEAEPAASAADMATSQ